MWAGVARVKLGRACLLLLISLSLPISFSPIKDDSEITFNRCSYALSSSRNVWLDNCSPNVSTMCFLETCMCPTCLFFYRHKELKPYTCSMYMKKTSGYKVHWIQITSDAQIRIIYPFQFRGWPEILTRVKCWVVGTLCRFQFLVGHNQAKINMNWLLLCIGSNGN